MDAATNAIESTQTAARAATPSPTARDAGALEFEVAIAKSERGFGIYFAKQLGADGAPDTLIVDGFVDAGEAGGVGIVGGSSCGEDDARLLELRSELVLGDTLIRVNDTDCRGLDSMEIVGLLRAAPVGENVLRFSRVCTIADNAETKTELASASIKSTVMGALLKVKSRIKAEIEGDEEELEREQLENELFERQWLAEFDRLKAEHETKWETCTYTADQFCGLLFHSSDEQQQAYLLREYPTLMQAWRDANLNASSMTMRPDWPAARITYESAIAYGAGPAAVSSRLRLAKAIATLNEQGNTITDSRDDDKESPPTTLGPRILASTSLQQALASLRAEFFWRERDLMELLARLDAAQIHSCAALLAALRLRHGAHFERAFQSRAYPRLTRAMCQRLERDARRLAQRDESIADLSMEPLRWVQPTGHSSDLDVWGSQVQGGASAGAAAEEEEEWEVADKGKDALLVLVDARKAMFARYEGDTIGATAPRSWFHAILELLIKLMKSKVIASDNSLLSIVLFGTRKRAETSSLESVYELQPLGYPTAQRIKELQSLLEEGLDLASEFQSMENSDKLAFSNALWHCGIAFSGAHLKKKDSQRVWIFTNDDGCVVPDADEKGRIQKQVQNHAELKRSLNLFYITPSGKAAFDLAKFYACAFKDFSSDEATEDDDPMGSSATAEGDAMLQPAFPVSSLGDLMEGSLRKSFRKRRLSSFPLHITKDVSIGVELYALAVVQKKSSPVALDASTNLALKSETKWLCFDTGAYLTPDQIKKYVVYGGKRVYFSPDDVVQIKHYDAPGLQLICFKPLSSLQWNENIRAPYFVYPCDGYIEGSSTAFVALLNSMVKRQKYALARLIARKSSEPRLVALIPQEEVHDELGQVQPTGFSVVYLPYVDDIRDVQVENEDKASADQVDAAKQLISKLKLADLPTFENPDLQKHYASVQALALGEEQLEFDETKDTTLPDEEGFAQSDVQEAILLFKDACGGDEIDRSNLKRKEKAPAARRTPKKKTAKAGSDGAPTAGDEFDKEVWLGLVLSDAIQKKSVANLKEFLGAHGQSVSGRKAELIARVCDFLRG